MPADACSQKPWRSLQVAVILSAICLVLMEAMSHRLSGEYSLYKAEEIGERNERSTPRSFVLPSTPAVAIEQEVQKAGGSQRANLVKCVGALRNSGFYIDDVRAETQLIEAVYKFQVAHRLSATGRLDRTTMELLKCA